MEKRWAQTARAAYARRRAVRGRHVSPLGSAILPGAASSAAPEAFFIGDGDGGLSIGCDEFRDGVDWLAVTPLSSPGPATDCGASAPLLTARPSPTARGTFILAHGCFVIFVLLYVLALSSHLWSLRVSWQPVLGTPVVALAPSVISSRPLFASANVVLAEDGQDNPYVTRCLANGRFRCCYKLVSVGQSSSQVEFSSFTDVFDGTGLRADAVRRHGAGCVEARS